MASLLRRKSKRRIVLTLSDVHGGHTLGLLNPATVLIRANSKTGDFEEWCPDLTEVQRRLWGIYTEHLAEAVEFAGDDEIIIFHNGDLTWGSKYPSGAISGITQDEQRVIGFYNLLPLVMLPNVTKVRLISGTRSHVPDSCEAKVAYTLRDKTSKNVRAFHHHRASVNGVTFDLAHHGPGTGIRDWLKGNVALIYLRSRIYSDRRLGIEPARVFIRGHYHEWVPVTFRDTWCGIDYVCDLRVLPSYSGLTWYARQVTQSTPTLTNGLCLFEIVDGQVTEIKPIKVTEDLRTEEVL